MKSLFLLSLNHYHKQNLTQALKVHQSTRNHIKKSNKWLKKCCRNQTAPINKEASNQQKQFFRRQGPSHFKRTTFKPHGEVHPYSPYFVPINIFENQVIATVIHNFLNALDQI